METTTLTVRGRVLAARTRTYEAVPFDVPAGTTRIDVAYRYSDQVGSDPHLTNGNTLDLGLIDAGGTAFGAMGFRGWSGSNRNSIFVALDEATPGYLPGPIQPGTWYAHLGFYKIASQGCDYELTIRLTSGEERPVRVPEFLSLTGQTAQAARRSDDWYRGELHCHTVHSDGDSTVQAVIEQALGLGLDFLAITDHNDLSHLSAMLDYQRAHKPTLTMIPGCEMTTYYGHWNAWGLNDWVEFRIETPDSLRRAIAEAKRRGALVSCNHPRAFGPDWEFRDVTDFDCLEVWNGPWLLDNDQALAYWETLTTTGRRLPLLGGSDMHALNSAVSQYVKLGTPTTWVYCPDTPTAPNLVDALRHGHSFVSESPDGPRLDFTVSGASMGETASQAEAHPISVRVRSARGSELVLISNGRVVAQRPIRTDDEQIDLTLSLAGLPYLRAEVWAAERDAEGLPVRRAISNPVYLLDQV